MAYGLQVSYGIAVRKENSGYTVWVMDSNGELLDSTLRYEMNATDAYLYIRAFIMAYVTYGVAVIKPSQNTWQEITKMYNNSNIFPEIA